MEEKTLIRIEVLNLTSNAWKKIDEITFNGYQINVTPKELIDLIGFDGGNFLSGKLNQEEKEFVDAYYKLGSELTR
jgi:hypothetical protein